MAQTNKSSIFYLCETWQVDQSQVKNIRRVDLKVDRLAIDAFVVSSYPRGLVLDLPLDIAKIVEASVGYVMELSPLAPTGRAGIPVGNMNSVKLDFILGDVDELKDQGSSSDDTTAAGQEISADDVLQHGRLSRRLRADDNLNDVNY